MARVRVLRSGRLAAACGAALAMVMAVATPPAAGETRRAASDNGSSLSVTSFTSDFSAMQQLRSLANKGKGKVVALLPDTQSSARYVSYDAPFLQQAFAAAGLSSSDFQVQNAQGSAQTMQTQA